MKPNPSSRIYWIVFYCLVAAVPALYQLGFTVDDTFITLRYAENLSQGKGAVFNIGEKVEGYSTPLWVFITTIFHWLPGSPLLLTKLFGFMCYLASLIILLQLNTLYRANRHITAILFILTAPLAMWSVSGMETPLVVLLYLSLLYQWKRTSSQKAGWALWFLLMALLLCRPEAPLMAALLWVSLFFEKRLSWTWAITFIAAALVLIGLRYAYYGDVLPNTYYAKSFQIISRWHVTLWNYCGSFLFSVGWLCFSIPGLYLFKKQRAAALTFCTIVGTQLYFVVSVGGDWMPGFRFFIAIMPFMALGVSLLFQQCMAFPLFKKAGWALVVPLILLYAFTNWNIHHKWLSIPWARFNLAVVRNTVANGNPSYEKIVTWLRNEKPDIRSIAVGELGYICYYSKLECIDLHGLVDPIIAKSKEYPNTVIGKKLPLHQKGFSSTNLGRYILSRQPGLFIVGHAETGGPADAIFDGQYIKISEIGNFQIFQPKSGL